jgi:hypothetical protein
MKPLCRTCRDVQFALDFLRQELTEVGDDGSGFAAELGLVEVVGAGVDVCHYDIGDPDLEIHDVADHRLGLEPRHVPKALGGSGQELLAHVCGAVDLLMI